MARKPAKSDKKRKKKNHLPVKMVLRGATKAAEELHEAGHAITKIVNHATNQLPMKGAEWEALLRAAEEEIGDIEAALAYFFRMNPKLLSRKRIKERHKEKFKRAVEKNRPGVLIIDRD